MQHDNENDPVLVDAFHRRIEYLRLSVTDRCDLRCAYCLPKGYRNKGSADHWLHPEEIERFVSAMVGLGVRRVRLTGGEPLTRPQIVDIADRLGRIAGLQDLSLSTNATQLTRLAEPLRRTGIRRLNVSLDSLRHDRFHAITGGRLERVLDGLAAARAAGFRPIKINMVVMRGINDDELDAMIEFCSAQDFVLRLIETMPMGTTGQAARARYVDLNRVKEALADRYTLVPEMIDGGGPARNYRIAETGLNIGFITPISQHFCATCNRVRLSAAGTLYLCLGQDHAVPFRPLLRQGADRATLQDAIRRAIAEKPERHEFREHPGQIVRFMAQTGG